MNPSSFQPYQSTSRQCEQCVHLRERTRKRCDAFPKGIPAELWNDEIEHVRPYPGDNDLQFELNIIADMKRRKRGLR